MFFTQIRCFFISCKLILYIVNFIYTLSRDESTYICPSHLKDVKMDERSITLNLQLLRLRRGLTQDNVAEAAGITRVAYSHLETGKVKILNRKISRIAEILGVSLEELLLGYQPEPDASGRLHELSAGYDEKYRNTLREFDNRLEEKTSEIATLRSLTESQKKTIATQEEIIQMLRRRIPEENA